MTLDLRDPLVRRAHDLARRAHEGNKRKGSGLPQFTHPVAVAEIVAAHGFAAHVIAGALLHDVVEDTPLEIEDLEGRFPDRVLAIVRDLTEPARDGPRSATWEHRKHAKLRGLREARDESLAVCAADRLHNLRALLPEAERRGAAAWEPFSRGPRETLWFEREVARLVRARLEHPLAGEYDRAVRELEILVATMPRDAEDPSRR